MYYMKKHQTDTAQYEYNLIVSNCQISIVQAYGVDIYIYIFFLHL